VHIFLVTLLVTAFVGGAAGAEPPQVLLHNYKCYLCHADLETKAGPAYVDVASKYRGNRNAVGAVAAVIRKGARGDAPWHMPPHPELSAADATAMARYILSLKN